MQVRELAFGWTRDRPLLEIPAFDIACGEHVFLHGPSGSGKSTLLSLLAGVQPARSGTIEVMGQDLAAMRAHERDAFRARHIGMVFQMFNLLPFLGVRDNVLLGCQLSRERLACASRKRSATAEADLLLAALGLDPARMSRRAVGTLSVGQQQRVAAARALIGNPGLVIADEPTSALDREASLAFLDLLLTQARDTGAAVLMVSHDERLAPAFDRQLSLPTLNAVQAT